MSHPSDPSDPGALSGWAKPDWSSEPARPEVASGWAPLGPAQGEGDPSSSAVAPPTPARAGGATAVVGSPDLPRRRRTSGPALGRGRLAVGLVGAAVIVLVGALVLGRSDGTEGEVQGRLSSALEAKGMADDDAACVAAHVVDEMGTEDLRLVEDFSAAEPPEGLSVDFDQRFGAAMTGGLRACDAVPSPG